MKVCENWMCIRQTWRNKRVFVTGQWHRVTSSRCLSDHVSRRVSANTWWSPWVKEVKPEQQSLIVHLLPVAFHGLSSSYPAAVDSAKITLDKLNGSHVRTDKPSDRDTADCVNIVKTYSVCCKTWRRWFKKTNVLKIAMNWRDTVEKAAEWIWHWC